MSRRDDLRYGRTQDTGNPGDSPAARMSAAWLTEIRDEINSLATRLPEVISASVKRLQKPPTQYSGDVSVIIKRLEEAIEALKPALAKIDDASAECSQRLDHELKVMKEVRDMRKGSKE